MELANILSEWLRNPVFILDPHLQAAPWTCWARHIKSLDGFVFFRLSYFDYSDLQLFAIFIFEVDFSETYLMTSAENSISEPSNMNIFLGRIPPQPPTMVVPSALAIMPLPLQKPSYRSVYHNQPFEQPGPVCETAPKFLFWSPTCVPGFWVWPWFSFKEPLSISQSGPIRLKGCAFPVIRWGHWGSRTRICICTALQILLMSAT